MKVLPAEYGAGEFVAFARALALNPGDLLSARAMAEKDGPSRVATVLRSAVAAGTTTDPNWAAQLTDNVIIAAGFLDSLRSIGVFDRLLAEGLRRVPARARGISVTASVSGSQAQQGRATPISALSLAAGALDPVCARCIVVISTEILRLSSASAMAFLSRELRGGVAAATDNIFVAGLKDGVSALPPAGYGGGAEGAARDLAALANAITTSAQARLFLLLPPLLAKRGALLVDADGKFAFPTLTPTGGTLGNIPAIVTDSLAADELMLVDAAQVAADSDVILLDAAASASLQLDDAPTNDGTIPTASSLVSLFQTGCRALKAARWFAFEKLTATGVAHMAGVEWGVETDSE